MRLQEYEKMVRKLSELTISELDGDMVEIELLVKNLMIVEPGEHTRMENIIDTDVGHNQD